MIKSTRKLTRFKYAATLPASAGGSTNPSNLPPNVNIGNLPRASATR